MTLYGYWRSSAAYRVRIALNLKGIEVGHKSVHLVKDGGQQHHADYIALNPQQLVPALVLENGEVLTQSMAMLEYLEDTNPESPLLPSDPLAKAKVRALANAIACDVHPLNNLRVLQYLKGEAGLDDAAKDAWYQHWIVTGFNAYEAMLQDTAGEFSFGDLPTLADICLVPQVYNARRFNVPLANYPNIVRIVENCNQLAAFADAAPENQADAV
ncbi:MAG: maleylacetoacetate isomerase [Shewanella sp.]|nr:maleylacetoacetate isomerase [Shewanella sp.]MCF1431447.1 maleylacetoacetate isomerase [Shewanella sp.]MCF1440083.1 maleylacetoacetate isomerase [Shewanella sp.]MCF1457193.1 maleylacetoacetate isomerase [Shewanella sp.]